MAITTRTLYELFETDWVMQRQNPGGKSPFLQGYITGFAGRINIADALTYPAKTAQVKIKVGKEPVQTWNVDFTTVLVNPTATEAWIEPAQAVTAFESSSFTGCDFSVDTATGRFKIAPTDPAVKVIQIYGDLAAALNFGQCRYSEGKGCYLWPSFSGNMKSAADAEEWSEASKITNESPTGAPVNYTEPGKRTGTTVTITDRVSSYEAKQMVNGGRWIAGDVDTPEVYEPPTAADNDSRALDVFTFSKVFDKSENTKGSEIFIRERMYIGCVGKMTRTGGAGSWSDSEYALTAGNFIDDSGRECASPRETNYTPSQWEAFGLKDCLVTDWENA